MEILSEEAISVPEAKGIMQKREKERDLVYEQKICLEFLAKTSSISMDKVKKMIEELQKIAILKPRYIVLILNMLPDVPEEVEALFSKELTNLKKDEIQKIVDIVKSNK